MNLRIAVSGDAPRILGPLAELAPEVPRTCWMRMNVENLTRPHAGSLRAPRGRADADRRHKSPIERAGKEPRGGADSQ